MKKLLFIVAAFVVASCTGGNQVADSVEVEVDTLVENAIDSLSLDSISEEDSICLD